MLKKHYSAEELEPVSFTVKLKAHIVRDMKLMEKNTNQPLDDLVAKALQMFIATHNDYLGRTKVS